MNSAVAKSPLTRLAEAIRQSCPAFIDSFFADYRYKVLYGGAGSGKSHAVARRLVYRFINESIYPRVNTGKPLTKHTILITRKVNRTIKKSCYKLVKNVLTSWCRKPSLGLSIKDFAFNSTELTITHRDTDSQIVFCGVDDPEKIKSIEGITTIWAEEANELNQEDFEQLDLRLRGDHGCVKEFYVTFNPVSAESWLKKIFFDAPISSVLTLKTTYLDNKHIDKDYVLVLENKKISNPRYYGIYALGNWGTAEGLVFDNVEYKNLKHEDIKHLSMHQGLDFGYTNDPSSFNQTYIDIENKTLYVYDGFYKKGMSNTDLADELKKMSAHRHLTTCDSSEPKSIDSLTAKGCRVRGALKGADSIRAGIDFLSEFKIVVNSHLVEFKTEFENYAWAIDKDGKATNKPVDDFNHFIDSLRYAVEHYYIKPKIKRLNIDG
tara:strand:+ start:413 stop:1717 length:1305 start_codon:yes stop_codon:yes gene_type:complete